jgi:hypothetical protein
MINGKTASIPSSSGTSFDVGKKQARNRMAFMSIYLAPLVQRKWELRDC